LSLTDLTIAEAGQQIRNGTITASELLEAHLERIGFLEPKLDAWVTIDADGARAAAKNADEETKAGKIRGHLHGIPVGVKDIYFTKGLRTTMGSSFYKDYVPDRDADVVAKLRDCGAVILGKTETTEFAHLDPAPTRNPWATGHTPGGSSSGSAAAVASRMAPLAFGSQTGGSVIRPAAYCGIVGIKPTYDLLSRGGIHPLTWSMDHVGFMTRTVTDAALTLDALASTETALYKPGRPLRVGYVEDYFLENAEPQVADAYDYAIQRLWRSEHLLDLFRLPPSFAAAHSAAQVIMATEAAALHREQFREHMDEYRPRLRGHIASGLLVPSSTYLQAQRVRSIYIRELLHAMKEYDAIVTPSTPTPAPEGLGSTGDSAFNVPWSLAGFPTLTVPSGFTVTGLPLGAQFVARPYNEPTLMALGKYAEGKFGRLGAPPAPA